MWLPSSTCDSRCLPRPGEVPRAALWVVAARVVAVAALLLAAVVVVPLLPAVRVPGAFRWFARVGLAATGVRHRMRGRLARRSALLVANHISWIDILVLMAYAPCRLLAKREVAGWPVIGRLAAAAGTLYIDRSRPRTLPHTVADVASALRAGGVVAAFPEGTTWCGRASGRFRPALFQAAVAADATVAPVRLRFRLADGSATTVAAYVGDGTLLTSIWRVLLTRGLTVEVRAYPALHSVSGSSRRALASVVRAALCTEWPGREPAATHAAPLPAVLPQRAAPLPVIPPRSDPSLPAAA